MTIVAEGVEQVYELQMLVEMGCNEIQGFLIGRPSPIAKLQMKIPDAVLEVLCAGRNETVAISA